jgi:hypothetical protein
VGADVDRDVVGDHVVVAMDTDQQGASPPSGDNLPGIVAALAHQSKGSLQLDDYLLHELLEGWPVPSLGLRVIEILHELRNDFGVCV